MMTMRIWKRTRTLVMASLVVAAVAAVGVPALGAHAESKDTGAAPKGCPVENVDANGNTTSTSTVPDGTRVGLFYCKNGEWKFGTVVLDLQVPGGSGPLTGTYAPVAVRGSFSAQR